MPATRIFAGRFGKLRTGMARSYMQYYCFYRTAEHPSSWLPFNHRKRVVEVR